MNRVRLEVNGKIVELECAYLDIDSLISKALGGIVALGSLPKQAELPIEQAPEQNPAKTALEGYR